MNALKTSRVKLSVMSSVLLVATLLLAACSSAATTGAGTETVVPGIVPGISTSAVTDTAALAGTAMVTDTAAAATMAVTDTPAATSAMTDTPAATSAVTDTAAATIGSTTATVSGTEMSTTTIDSSTNATLGKFLVDSKGMTLYLYKLDTPGVSACTTAACLSLWPPLVAANKAAPLAGTGVSGTLGVITRADGISQVTYKNLPLYYYSLDKAAGDTTGQGIGSNWYIVVP